MTGSHTVEIDAPIDRVFEIAADLDHAPEWQGTMSGVEVLERDGEGRATRVETTGDAKVVQIKTNLRFSYDPPTGMSWDQEKGELKSLHGSWRFEDLDGTRTRATYSLEGEPGFKLGLLLRGPVMDRVVDFATKTPAEGLKKRAEGG